MLLYRVLYSIMMCFGLQMSMQYLNHLSIIWEWTLSSEGREYWRYIHWWLCPERFFHIPVACFTWWCHERSCCLKEELWSDSTIDLISRQSHSKRTQWYQHQGASPNYSLSCFMAQGLCYFVIPLIQGMANDAFDLLMNYTLMPFLSQGVVSCEKMADDTEKRLDSTRGAARTRRCAMLVCAMLPWWCECLDLFCILQGAVVFVNKESGSIELSFRQKHLREDLSLSTDNWFGCVPCPSNYIYYTHSLSGIFGRQKTCATLPRVNIAAL